MGIPCLKLAICETSHPPTTASVSRLKFEPNCFTPPDRKLIDVTRHQGMRDIGAIDALFGRQIVVVCRARIAGVGPLVVALDIVEEFGVGVRDQRSQPLTEAVVVADLQCVVVGEADRRAIFAYRAILGIRRKQLRLHHGRLVEAAGAGSGGDVSIEGIGDQAVQCRLAQGQIGWVHLAPVQVAGDDVYAMVADVVHVQPVVGRKPILPTEQVLLHVARFALLEIAGDAVADLLQLAKRVPRDRDITVRPRICQP